MVLPFQFETAKPGNPLYCHQDFLEKLEANRSSPVGKRAALLLHRLLVDERRQPYKSTQGLNRGWRRSRLGGQGGSHFYLWWAPRGAPPLKPLTDFESTPEGAIFLRDIRHHDDHSTADPQSLNDHYIEVGAKELRAGEYVPEPWTLAQSRFAGARGTIRILKGHPGSGKTTALWNAADITTRESSLYLTYSPDLASLARDHFEKYTPKEKHFRVATFSQFLRDVLETAETTPAMGECRARFLRDIGGFSPRTLGPWADNKVALFDELHAHWAGEVLPAAVGRFTASASGHLSERVYRERRERFLGKAGIATVLDVLTVLSRREPTPMMERYFPDLALAWRVAEKLLHQPLPAWLARLDCVSVDEVQDLTPLEAFCAVQLVAAIRKAGNKYAALLVAGDEAQTIRPTDFEWGWFQDIVHFILGDPMEFKLSTNLRSPRRIAEQVNKVWDLYGHISKQDRPGGVGRMDMEEDSSDQLTLCAATAGEPLRQLLEALSQREGLALLSLADDMPAYVPEHLRAHVLTVNQAKGLDFHSVCILDAGNYLEKIVPLTDRLRSDHQVESLTRRLAIDQLRVAVSRPAEKLIWLNVDCSDRAAKLSEGFMGVHRVIPELVIKTLEEDALDVEERVQLCEADARQYLAVKPELAFVRARQAVSLVEGMPDRDENLGRSAYLTLAQVCFTLAYRSITLPRELGRPDLYDMASQCAVNGKKAGLASVITSISTLRGQNPHAVPARVAELCYRIAAFAVHIEPWLLNEIAPKGKTWIEIAEEEAAGMPAMYGGSTHLPKVYELFGIPDWQPRYRRLQEKMIGQFINLGSYGLALKMLEQLPERQIKLEAQCRKGIGDLPGAAEAYLAADDLLSAVDCYRSIPDFQKTIELLERVPTHPAKQSLAWVQLVQQVVEARPDNFSKVILPAEKKMLEQILEGALGVSRKKRTPATKKAAVKKVATKAVKKAVKKPTKPPRPWEPF
jgi:hypothetical protein